MPDLSVFDLITVTEDIGFGTLNVNDTIGVGEYTVISLCDDFSKFLRSYPYVEVTLSNVEHISLGGGYEQSIDLWGRQKKQFNIVFPPRKREEIKAIRDFYELQYNKTFCFTEPNWNQTYQVRVVEQSFEFERIGFNTYMGGFSIIEVV